MALTDYLTIGSSGLRVSPFCLGAMTFGEDWGWGSSVAESEAIISHFLERGGNFIDTANVYTKGHSEQIIGDVIGHTSEGIDRRDVRPHRRREQTRRNREVFVVTGGKRHACVVGARERGVHHSVSGWPAR